MKSWVEKLKKLLGLSKKSSGFTLIELLVVIGILGILAAALVATINPFEQLNKAQDSNVENTLVEYVNGNVRYYTTRQAMPWLDASNTDPNVTNCVQDYNAAGSAFTAENLTNIMPCVNALVDDNELQSSFTGVSNILDQIYITGGSTSVTACYAPKSKSMQNNLNTKFNSSGGLAGSSCPGSAGCFWCNE